MSACAGFASGAGEWRVPLLLVLARLPPAARAAAARVSRAWNAVVVEARLLRRPVLSVAVLGTHPAHWLRAAAEVLPIEHLGDDLLAASSPPVMLYRQVPRRRKTLTMCFAPASITTPSNTNTFRLTARALASAEATIIFVTVERAAFERAWPEVERQLLLWAGLARRPNLFVVAAYPAESDAADDARVDEGQRPGVQSFVAPRSRQQHAPPEPQPAVLPAGAGRVAPAADVFAAVAEVVARAGAVHSPDDAPRVTYLDSGSANVLNALMLGLDDIPSDWERDAMACNEPFCMVVDECFKPRDANYCVLRGAVRSGRLVLPADLTVSPHNVSSPAPKVPGAKLYDIADFDRRSLAFRVVPGQMIHTAEANSELVECLRGDRISLRVPNVGEYLRASVVTVDDPLHPAPVAEVQSLTARMTLVSKRTQPFRRANVEFVILVHGLNAACRCTVTEVRDGTTHEIKPVADIQQGDEMLVQCVVRAPTTIARLADLAPLGRVVAWLEGPLAIGSIVDHASSLPPPLPTALVTMPPTQAALDALALPLDLFAHVFSFLTEARDFVAVARTCRAFRVASQFIGARPTVRYDSDIDDVRFRRMIVAFRNAHRLEMATPQSPPHRWIEFALAECPRLSQISLATRDDNAAVWTNPWNSSTQFEALIANARLDEIDTDWYNGQYWHRPQEEPYIVAHPHLRHFGLARKVRSCDETTYTGLDFTACTNLEYVRLPSLLALTRTRLPSAVRVLELVYSSTSGLADAAEAHAATEFFEIRFGLSLLNGQQRMRDVVAAFHAHRYVVDVAHACTEYGYSLKALRQRMRSFFKGLPSEWRGFITCVHVTPDLDGVLPFQHGISHSDDASDLYGDTDDDENDDDDNDDGGGGGGGNAAAAAAAEQ